MVARDLLLAAVTKGRLHIAHISTAGSVQMLRDAKDRGIDVTAEATPHHLSLTDEAVLSLEEVERIACGLTAIDAHFKPLLDPDDADPWFAMEVELKLLGDSRRLLFKQTRPHIFGGLEPIGDCREI